MARRLEELSPAEFEREVHRVLSLDGCHLKYFVVKHLDKIRGVDGEYTFDVTATFEVLGGDILVVIECKHQKDPVKREVLQVLHDKMLAVGAHKGMVFSTAGFQSGASAYAEVHRIALVRMTDSGKVYVRKGLGIPSTAIPESWIAVPGGDTYRTLDGEGRALLTSHLFGA